MVRSRPRRAFLVRGTAPSRGPARRPLWARFLLEPWWTPTRGVGDRHLPQEGAMNKAFVKTERGPAALAARRNFDRRAMRWLWLAPLLIAGVHYLLAAL